MTRHKNDNAFDAFISYSGPREMPKLVFSRLSRLGASPWPFSKWWGLKVFFDKRQVRAGDDLPKSISDAVATSNYFVLLASKAAAQSKWVARELEFWLERKPASKILIIVVDGQIEWDHKANDFNWNVTDCIPPILRGKYKKDCCREDLRPVNPSVMDRAGRERLREVIASVGAKILDKPRESILSVEARKRKWSLAVSIIVVAALIGVSVVAGYYKYMAETPADALVNEARKKLAGRKDSKDVLIAQTKLKKALELDPKHAPAWTALAGTHILLIGFGGSSNQDRDFAAAEEALRLAKTYGGDKTSEYHRVLGRLVLYKHGDVLGARKLLTKAVEIDPNNLDALYALASTYTFLGDHKKAVELCQRALQIVSELSNGEEDDRFVHAQIQLAWTYFYAGQTKAAIDLSEEVLRRGTSPAANRFLAHAFLLTGNFEASVANYLIAIGQNPSQQGDAFNNYREPNLYPNYLCALVKNGQVSVSTASQKLRTLLLSGKYVSPYRLAQGYACMGETKQALEQLKRAQETNDLFVVWSRVDPLLANLHNDHEFQEYLGSVGLLVVAEEHEVSNERTETLSTGAVISVAIGLVAIIAVAAFFRVKGFGPKKDYGPGLAKSAKRQHAQIDVAKTINR